MRHPQRSRVWGLMVAACFAIAGGGPACKSEDEGDCLCPTYACENQATLTGEVTVPEGTAKVTVRYCSEEACLEGGIDLSEVDDKARCLRFENGLANGEVCFSRDEAGKLQLDAALGRGETGTLPDDREGYRFTIVDDESGETLVQEKREADYEVTREDCCHLCWAAEMTL